MNQAAASHAMSDYVDPRRAESAAGLMYMGILTGLTLPEDETCEMWLGPCGVQYYHIHKKDDLRYASYAGGDPIARGRREDPGRVYIFLTTMQSDWVGLAFRSALRFFSHTKRFAPNAIFQVENGAQPLVDDMDEAAREEAELIQALPPEKHMQVAVDAAFDVRFTAKLALGLGRNILGPDFMATPHAQNLRGLSREQDIDKDISYKVLGISFLAAQNDPSMQSLSCSVSWPGAYTILITSTGTRLVLNLFLPSGQATSMLTSDAPELWRRQDLQKYSPGQAYLVLPQLGRFVDEIPFAQYVSHRNGTSTIPILSKIKALRVDRALLPACR